MFVGPGMGIGMHQGQVSKVDGALNRAESEEGGRGVKGVRGGTAEGVVGVRDGRDGAREGGKGDGRAMPWG